MEFLFPWNSPLSLTDAFCVIMNLQYVEPVGGHHLSLLANGSPAPDDAARRNDLNHKTPRLQFFALIIAAGFLAAVPHPSSALTEGVSETRLSNGMKVILLEDHKVPVITFQVWYRVGSRNEEWGKTGLTHLIEHLMFKGTEKISAGEFIRTIQENGGNYNAFTSQDFTAYFENIRADRVQVPLQLESDRMKNLIIKDREFQTERMVVIEERRLRLDDNPQAFLLEQVSATAFQTQPYHWPVIGWPSDLERLTPEDAREYYQEYYKPINAFIVVVGDFKRETLLLEIEKAFGSIPQGKAPEVYHYDDPPQLGERRLIVQKSAQLPSIMMAYHVPNLQHPDSYILDVIATTLAGGKSSRFNERLVRKEALVLSVDAQNSLVSFDPNLFYISAELLPGRDVREVERVVDEELERLRREPVGERELTKAKNQLEAAFVFGQDSVFSQGMMLAMYEITDSWRRVEDYIPSIRKVTAEDIRRVANQYLIPANRTVGILLPVASQDGRAVPKEDKEGTAKKNGGNS